MSTPNIRADGRRDSAGAGVAGGAGGAGRSNQRCSVPPRDETGSAVSCEKRRLRRDALIELEVGLGLLEEVVVRRRLGVHRPRRGGPRAGAIGGGRGGSPMWVRMRSTGSALVMNEMMRMSAPQLGHTSGRDSNSRASSMTQRWSAGERALEAGARCGELNSVGAPAACAISRPKPMAAARSDAFGASTPW